VQGGGVVQEDGPYYKRPYYVMEYVAGRDLASWAREKPRSPGACAAMMVRVCEIVDFFHQRAIIHRDLKPQNVIVSFEGDVPKICDFGLAKVEDSKLTRTGDIMGTPQFMPPEQALGEHKKVFTPTDVYSLGAVLYFLLAGEPPFDLVRTITGKRGTLVDLIDRIVREPAPRVRDKNPAVPPALEAIVLKCFEKDPRNRFHTARDLGTALKGLNLPL
jgi:serine/threonine protein kinase